MELTTKLSKAWKKRQIIASTGLILFGFYCFYDGAVDWPRKNERFLAHKEFMAARENMDYDQRQAEWKAFAQSKNWPAKPPEKFHSKTDLMGQFGMGGVSIFGGLLTGGWLLLSMRQRLYLSGDVIHGVRGESVPVGAITGVDRRKWESKGIAYATYSLNGKSGRLTLDDYKFQGTEKILLFVERQLGISYEVPVRPEDQPESPSKQAEGAE